MENFKLPRVFDYNGNLEKRWFVEFQYLHPETKQYKKFREFISLKLLTKQARYVKCQEIKARLSAKLRSGFNPFNTTNKTALICEAVDIIVELKRATCRKKSYTSYKSMTGAFKAWLYIRGLAKISPEEFSRQHAHEYLDYLVTARGLSNCTRNCHLICMKTVFNDLMAREYMDVNVWQPIKRLPVTEPNIVLLNDQDRETIKQNLPQSHYRLYCVSLLVYNCYLRPAEIVRLQAKDFDLHNNRILVQGAKSKNKKRYFVAVPEAVVKAFEVLKIGDLKPDFFVFSNGHHLTPGPKEIAPTRISEAWKIYVKDALGVQRSIYDMKHNGNGAALAAGIDVRQIQLQNRHSSLEETQRYLDRIIKTPGQAFIDKMPAF